MHRTTQFSILYYVVTGPNGLIYITYATCKMKWPFAYAILYAVCITVMFKNVASMILRLSIGKMVFKMYVV